MERGAVMLVLFGILGLVLLLVGLLLAWLGILAAKRAYLLDAPLVRAADLQPGFCRVRGRVVAVDEPMRSPVTDRPCVYYRLRVLEEKRKWKKNLSVGRTPVGQIVAMYLGGFLGGMMYRAMTDDETGSSKGRHQLLPVLDAADSIPLVIEDASGRVPVDLRDAEVIAKEKSRIVCDFQHPAPDRLRDLLRKKYRLHTVDDNGKLKTMNFTEDLLPEGVKVTVIGTVEAGPDGAPCFRAASDGLLVSERDVGKQAKSARKAAFGFAVAAGGTLLLAVGTLAAVAAVWTV
jgi:hypothetical protein